MERTSETERSPGLRDLPGVGPARAAKLAAAGIREVRDLLRVLPLRLDVAPPVTAIGDAIRSGRSGAPTRVFGTVERTNLARFGRRSIFRLRLADGTGSVEARFHNQPWLQRQLVIGQSIELCGPLDGSPPGFTGPRIGTVERPLPVAGALTPEHPTLAGLSGEFLGSLCRAALATADDEVDPIPAFELEVLDVPPMARALRGLHAPASALEFEAARRRFALERMLELQARLLARRLRAKAGAALVCDVSEPNLARARAVFPFEFTRAQTRVAGEIAVDMARTRPMRRLLQGDVGSGKTAVGAFAALLAAGAGGQVAFLAPTELLAEQHHLGLAPLLAGAGLRAGFLSGSLTARARRGVLAGLADGSLHVVFGTHALFSSDVVYRRLALAVVDEQHRFGVAQRGELFDKGVDAHALLMSATPIPRTLALAWYGDLDTSVLDEKPPGRGTVTTRWLRGGGREEVESLLLERVSAGERLYWVVPRIGEGEVEVEPEFASGRRAESAEERHARLLRSPLAAHGIELVHGRMPLAERGRRLARFRAGEVRTLVATTVIEVGVDVPEATVLVVEGAERLGLAQLHQLRGRVGRGSQPSYCLLIGADSARRRFQVLERTTDGFEIAEEDLRQRGMGDLGGSRQAGANSEGFDEWGDDLALFHAAQRLVSEHATVRDHYARTVRRELTP